MEERLPEINELGEDFWNSCVEDDDEAFFNAKASKIIDSISDEKYIEILTKAGVEDAKDEAEYKDVDTLASALMMAFALSDEGKTADEFYDSLEIN